MNAPDFPSPRALLAEAGAARRCGDLAAAEVAEADALRLARRPHPDTCPNPEVR